MNRVALERDLRPRCVVTVSEPRCIEICSTLVQPSRRSVRRSSEGEPPITNVSGERVPLREGGREGGGGGVESVDEVGH